MRCTGRLAGRGSVSYSSSKAARATLRTALFLIAIEDAARAAVKAFEVDSGESDTLFQLINLCVQRFLFVFEILNHRDESVTPQTSKTLVVDSHDYT